MLRRLLVVLGAAVVAASTVAPRAATGAPAWQTTLGVDGNPASIEALRRGPSGPLWAVGGHTTPEHYDVPTTWWFGGGAWHERQVPVLLTGKWGYLEDIATIGAADAWTVGHTVTMTNGQPFPLVAHWDGSSWSVVDEPWVDAGHSGYLSAVVAQSRTDVWAFGGDSFGSTTPMAWHFDGLRWLRRPLPIRNPHCSAGPEVTVTSAVATRDGIYVSANCTTSIFQLAGTVMHLDGRRWRTVLALDSRSSVMGLGADPAGTVWAAGSTFVSGNGVAGAWTGGPDGFTQVGFAGPPFSILYAAASNGTTVVLAGEIGGGPNGPVPLVFEDDGDGLDSQSIPFDRQLSSAYVGPTGRVWVGGPSFGGWLGSQQPEATVLTRAAVS